MVVGKSVDGFEKLWPPLPLPVNPYVLGGQHCACPVATVRDFGGRSVGGGVDLGELGD